MIPYSVYDIANEIYLNEFDMASGSINFFYLSGWVANNIGTLNTRIFTDFSVSGDTILPSGDFTEQERAIYKALYMYEYYGKAARNVLIGLNSSDWLEIRESDSVLKRVNKNEVSKSYRSLATDAKAIVDDLVGSYKIGKAVPRQTVGFEAPTGANSGI